MPPPSSSKPTLPWKGNSKLSEIEGYDDLNPTITYRHILSQNLGVRDPLRVVALCDSDAFYANCEMVRLKVDPDTPLVVLQWDSLIAVNYPARNFGISRMDKKKDALKRCPELMVVHVATYKEGEKEPGYWDNVDTNTHKVSLDYYRRESMKIAAMFREELPGCEVEKTSIDEAFIDFTRPVREVLLQRYPYLAQVPSDALEGMDTPLPSPPFVSWDGLGSLIPVNSPPKPATPPSESSSEDEAKGSSSPAPDAQSSLNSSTGLTTADNKPNDIAQDQLFEELELVEEPAPTWHDVALSIAAEMMSKARERVRVELGYSTSAGISRNKFLAKLTASYKKPNSQSILRNAAIPNYLRPMPFQKIRFLGGKLGKAMAEEYDVSTVGDLLTIGLDEMQTKFGEQSIWVYEILRGIDRNEVKDKGSALNKSMLASKNLPMAITKPSEGQHWIRVLAAELALRLGDAREISPNLWPKTLVLHVRKGYETARSKQAPFPFTKDPSVDFISNIGNRLWKELVGNYTTLNITNVQLAFTGIDIAESGQQSIEGFLKPSSSSSSKRRLSDVVTDAKPRSVSREAKGLRNDGRSVKDDEESDRDSKGKGKRKSTPFGSSDSVGNPDRRGNTPSKTANVNYICPRCSKAIQIPSLVVEEVGEDDALARIKMEHEDWHFAQDLANEGQERLVISANDSKRTKTKAKVTTAGSIKSTSSSGASKGKKRKTTLEPRGLDKFFGSKSK